LNSVKLSVRDLGRFTSDTLRHFAFDAMTLNIRSVLAVTGSNSVSNFSEIEQSAAEL